MRTTMILGFFSALLLANIAYAQQTEAQREIAKVLNQTVHVVSEKLPMIIDGDTRLDSVATTGNQFIYTNTLTQYTAEQMDHVQLNLVIQENVIDPICFNKDMKGFIDLGVVMVYRYLGKSGRFITELSLDTKTCKTVTVPLP